MPDIVVFFANCLALLFEAGQAPGL